MPKLHKKKKKLYAGGYFLAFSAKLKSNKVPQNNKLRKFPLTCLCDEWLLQEPVIRKAEQTLPALLNYIQIFKFVTNIQSFVNAQLKF